jgi:hypothetical protein
MTLADAFHLLNTSGCRLKATPDGGIAVTVPEGAVVPAAVLDVLRNHREHLVAALVPASAPAEVDLRDYLGTKGIAGEAAALVENAVQVFRIRHDRITVERDHSKPEVAVVEPGVPFLTLADTEWASPAGGTSIIPGGTLGLAIPQVWAIADRFDRHGIEAILESIRRRKLPRHIPVWLDGHARVIEITLVDFEHAVATPGMNLMPWRPQPEGSPAP